MLINMKLAYTFQAKEIRANYTVTIYGMASLIC